MILRAVSVVAGGAFALVLAVPAAPPATAQTAAGCATSAPIEAQVANAPVVFIGTVAALGDEDRVATVDVVRVWRGGPIPAKVQVRGTIATQSKVRTALDRTYAKGATYLFLPTAGTSPRLIENQCSATAPLTRELAALAPAGGGDLPIGTSDVAATPTDYAKVLPLAIGGAAFVVLGGLLFVARRKGRTAGQRP